MEEPKKLIYDSGEQPEEVFLRVSGYLDRDRLYVGIYQIEYGYPELFSDLTVNLHSCSAERCERSLYRPQFQQRASAFYSEIQAGQGTSGDRSLPVTAPFRRSPLT